MKKALADHAAKGGKIEIVPACFTSHTAGMATGVLGDMGFNGLINLHMPQLSQNLKGK